MNWLYRRFLVSVRGFNIDETARLGDVTLAPGVSIGAHTDFVSGRVACSRAHPVRIGNHVAIGEDVYIESESFHFDVDRRAEHFPNQDSKELVIGDNVFIGNKAIVLASVGANSIVGAGAVIPPGKPVPENCLAVGNPVQIKIKHSERIDI